MLFTKYTSTFILFIVFINSIFGQDIILKNSQKAQVDHLGNTYIIEKNNFSLILNTNLKEYQNNFFGNIYSVDLSNPLRILIYHKEANEIVFLNNELSIIGDAISLDELGLPDVAVVCASLINGFWVYNNLNNRIEFYNSNLKKIHTSINLSNQINNLDDIENIKMFNERIYLKVKNTGILVFDMFATFIKTIPIKNTNSFQILDKSLLYTLENKVLIYNFDSLETTVLFLGENNIDYARVYNGVLYYVENHQFYRLKLTGATK